MPLDRAPSIEPTMRAITRAVHHRDFWSESSRMPDGLPAHDRNRCSAAVGVAPIKRMSPRTPNVSVALTSGLPRLLWAIDRKGGAIGWPMFARRAGATVLREMESG